MKVIALLMTVTVLIFASKTQAQDAAKGATLYSTCIECHGKNGAGVESMGPRLAGQYDWYIVTALTDYKKGERKHPSMKNPSQQDMLDLAAHISRLK